MQRKLKGDGLKRPAVWDSSRLSKAAFSRPAATAVGLRRFGRRSITCSCSKTYSSRLALVILVIFGICVIGESSMVVLSSVRADADTAVQLPYAISDLRGLTLGSLCLQVLAGTVYFLVFCL